jgi:UDP-arabinose 4-epimerase
MVFSSTCAVYGAPDRLPISETTPRAPINPYGVTKFVVEEMLADFQRAHGLSWVALRYFNAAGADPEGELGENHEPETHAIPLAVNAALGRGPAFKIFGTDYDTKDGSAVRDYVHVSDLADAHVMAAEHLAGGGESLALNLGSGVGTSVHELLAAVAQAAGRPAPVVVSSRRTGDAPVLYASADRAAEVLGWRARRTSMTETVASVVKWTLREVDRSPD